MRRLKKFINQNSFVIHPLLFAIFPLLSFSAANASEIRSGDFKLMTFLLFNLIVAAVAWLISLLVTGDIKKASILAVVFLAIFFIFGRVHNYMQGFAINNPISPLGPTKILLLISGVLVILVWLSVRRLSPETTKKINSTLMLIGSVVVISALVPIASVQISDSAKKTKPNQQSQTNIDYTTNSQERPDIYYIVLDGYARADFLKDKFGYDNSNFLNSLRDRGFYVADQSYSNYAHTHFSIPSTLSMKYLNYLADEVGEKSTNRLPLKEQFFHSEAVRTFKSLGYKYVHIGSHGFWSKSDPQVDIDIKTKEEVDSKIFNIKLDEFALVYLQTTAVKPWISTDIKGTLVAEVLSAFERTERVSDIDEPTFTFTHIVSPHPPYLFDSKGVIPGQTKLELDNHNFSDRNKYKEQTIYTNKLALSLVDNILKNSDKSPIIIIASDHGPASGLSPDDIAQTDPSKFKVDGVKERMGILNTYYFPDKNYSKLYPSITPVNSFRIILNQYFGQKLELLPDRSYFSDNNKNEYLMHDVTDLVH